MPYSSIIFWVLLHALLLLLVLELFRFRPAIVSRNTIAGRNRNILGVHYYHQPFEHKGPTDTAYNINHVYYMLLLNVKLNIDKAMVKYLAQSGPCSMLNQMTRPGIRIQTPTVADDKQYTRAGEWCSYLINPSSTNWSYINCMQCSWQMQRQYELNKKDY